MKIITQKAEKIKDLSKIFTDFCREIKVFAIMKQFGAAKARGVPFKEIFEFLLQLVFTGKNLFSSDTPLSKDSVHRFLNNAKIHWEKILLIIANTVIAKVYPLTSEKRINAIVVDDSPYYRNRSKKVELLAKVHNHASKAANKFFMGFRMLTLGFTDGNTFIPFAAQLMSSAKTENKAKEFDKRSIAARRRKNALVEMPQRLYELLRTAKIFKIPAAHVLFDSWFSNPVTLMTIKNIGYFCVAMLKKGTTKYRYNGEMKTLNQIYSAVKKRPGRAKYLASVDIILEHKDFDKPVSAKIVFVRDKSNKKKWCAIISTDTSLSEEQIIELYGKRWDIEVFFKMCKSYLKLAKEFEGRSYDMLTAHTAIVFIRYICIAWEQRKNEDSRCFGEIFFLVSDELKDIQFAQAVELILIALSQTLHDALFLSDEQVQSLIDRFFDRLPALYSHLLLKCES